LIKRCREYVEVHRVLRVPRDLRGIYVLDRKVRSRGKVQYDVVDVGMAAKGGMRARLKLHRRKKKGHWSHFSLFEVWDNIRDEEIRELEGLFRHIYKFDSQASPLNTARGFKAIRAIPKLELT
jgi:hypothetical protein